MQRVTGYLLLLFAGTSNCQTMDKKLPEPIQTDNPALVRSALIYPLNQKPTAQCHASTLVELSDGIMAAWFGGTHEKNRDVGIWTAVYRNSAWSKPAEVANGVVNDSIRYPCWNPVLFKPHNGPLLLFYKVGPSPSEWWGMLITSHDEGKSWSRPVRLGNDPAIGNLIGPVKNKPIQLLDGTIICPSSTEQEIDGKDKWRVHFEVTPDLGKTWKVIGPINDGVTFNAIQPSLLTYGNSKMQILCRTREDVIGQSWSNDNGKTWSTMSETNLPNPNSGTDAVTLNDGRQLMVYNHTKRRGEFPSGRNMLNIALSKDGITWTTVITLEKSEGEFSYPAVIQTRDGHVHVSYTYQRRSIKHVVIDAGKI